MITEQIGVKSVGNVRLYSRNSKPFDKKFAYIAEALRELPDDTTVDGEIVALDDSGRPSFNLLQNFVSEAGRIRYFVFDLLCHKGRDFVSLPLIERRKALATLKFRSEWIRIAYYFEADSDNLLRAAREQQLEGIIGKQRDSRYEPGKRTGAWIKHRLNAGQEICSWWLHSGSAGLRRHHRWLLSRQGSRECGADAKRICTGVAAGSVPETQASDYFGMPFRQSSGNEKGEMG
jgi:hypothetical protein